MRSAEADPGHGATRGLATFAPILAIAGAFLAFGALAIDDFGITWDEGEKIHEDESYLAIFQRIEPWDPMVLHLPGYFYAFDTARALYAKSVGDLLPSVHPVLVHHSFNLLVSTACLVLLYALVLRVGGDRRLAALAAISLALMPQFLGHSQNNPKDLPATFCFLSAALTAVATADRPTWRSGLLSASAFGLAFTTRVLSAMLLPILGLWLALRRRDLAWRGWKVVASGVAAGAVVAVALWPALWFRGADLLDIAAKRLAVLRRLDVKVLYLGEVHPWTELPWHYTAVHLLITLPLALLALALLAPIAARSWRARQRSRCDVLWLGFIWLAVLLVADPFAPLHYDGIRHVLPVLPALAMLAAGGALLAVEALEGLLASRRVSSWRALSWACVASLFLATALELIAVHPYQTAYLNPIANALAGPRTEEWVEVEYWGATYKEGAEWLNRNAPDGALVYFPIGGGPRSGEDIAEHYLRHPIATRGTLEQFRDTSAPRYLMFITRSAWYDDMIRGVRASYEPVYTIRRQRGTLLEIYANRAAPREE